jgi:hypothetical protein
MQPFACFSAFDVSSRLSEHCSDLRTIMNLGDMPRSIEENPKDLEDLQRAVRILKTPSLTAQLTNLLGAPVEFAVRKLPKGAQERVGKAVTAALTKACAAGTWKMSDAPAEASTKTLKGVVALTGAAGGFFGLPGTLVELPITTSFIMRAIADVARSEGFRPSDFQTQLHCVEVFGLEGIDEKDADAGYFAARAAMGPFFKEFAKELADIAAKQAGRQANDKMGSVFAKWLASMVEKIATRFGITITEKVAAQLVPVLGAAAGASLNALFMDFYQNMARGHFILKRLELIYDEAGVAEAAKKYAQGKS